MVQLVVPDRVGKWCSSAAVNLRGQHGEVSISAYVQEVGDLPSILVHPTYDNLAGADECVTGQGFVDWWSRTVLFKASQLKKLRENMSKEGSSFWS